MCPFTTSAPHSPCFVRASFTNKQNYRGPVFRCPVCVHGARACSLCSYGKRRTSYLSPQEIAGEKWLSSNPESLFLLVSVCVEWRGDRGGFAARGGYLSRNFAI
jgi:hypothetical protein